VRCWRRCTGPPPPGLTLPCPLPPPPPRALLAQVFLATTDKLVPGDYYADCNPMPSSGHAHNAELGRQLWALSERMCAAHCDA